MTRQQLFTRNWCYVRGGCVQGHFNRTSTTCTWRRQILWRLTYVETTWNKINGCYCHDSDPFWPSNLRPKHRYSVSVNVMSCPGTTWGVQIHLRNNSKHTWPTYDRCCSQVEKIRSASFLDLHSSGLKRHHSERSWLVLQEAIFLRAEWTTTRKGGKKEASAWRWKEVSRSPVNTLQSLYGPVFPSEFSIAMKLVLMTICIKAILLDLQYSDISIRKTMANDPTKVDCRHEFCTTPVGIQSS